MAGGGEGEEENYWPGYVDALTTMTMVLTFVMMILGVMIFILSQDQAAKSLGNVARALKIDGMKVEAMSAPELQDVILQTINRGGDGKGAGGESVSKEGGRLALGDQIGIGGGAGPSKDRGSGPNTPSQNSGSGPYALGDGAIPGARINPDRDASQMQSQSKDMMLSSDAYAAAAGGAGLSRPATQAGESTIESQVKGGLLGDKEAGLGGDFHLTEKAEVRGNQEGFGQRQTLGTGAVRFVYDRDAIQLPDDAGDALRAFVQSQGFAELAVEAKAVPGQVGLTEARRKAYFRAMIIRSELMKQGVRPAIIQVQVKDADQISMPETVDIIKKNGP